MTDIKINVDGQALTIHKESTEHYLDIFDKRIKEVSEETKDGKFTPLFEREATNTQEDIHDERIALVNALANIDNDVFDELKTAISRLVKTKKGVFRKNTVNDFFPITSATNYFTDYTNAWYTKVIKLRALTPTTLELVFEDKTYTF